MAVNYNVCSKCGKYYTSYMGAMGHSHGACERMPDHKERVLAALKAEAKAAQDALDQAQG